MLPARGSDRLAYFLGSSSVILGQREKIALARHQIALVLAGVAPLPTGDEPSVPRVPSLERVI